MSASSPSRLSIELLSRVLHKSFASPWDRSQGQPGEYVGENKGMHWFLCPGPGEGKIEDIVLTSKERGMGFKICSLC